MRVRARGAVTRRERETRWNRLVAEARRNEYQARREAMKKYGTNDGGDATTQQPIPVVKRAAGAPNDASDAYNRGAERYLRGENVNKAKNVASDRASSGPRGSGKTGGA